MGAKLAAKVAGQPEAAKLSATKVADADKLERTVRGRGVARFLNIMPKEKRRRREEPQAASSPDRKAQATSSVPDAANLTKDRLLSGAHTRAKAAPRKGVRKNVETPVDAAESESDQKDDNKNSKKTKSKVRKVKQT